MSEKSFESWKSSVKKRIMETLPKEKDDPKIRETKEKINELLDLTLVPSPYNLEPIFEKLKEIGEKKLIPRDEILKQWYKKYGFRDFRIEKKEEIKKMLVFGLISLFLGIVILLCGLAPYSDPSFYGPFYEIARMIGKIIEFVNVPPLLGGPVFLLCGCCFLLGLLSLLVSIVEYFRWARR
jgi:hypothetical protein